MKPRNLFYIFLALIGGALAIYVAFRAFQGIMSRSQEGGNVTVTQKAESERPGVVISGITIPVEVVDTPEERAQGLSGKESLPEEEGMLFSFETLKTNPAFWMKDMMFSIDIIWISDGRIVQINRSVPAPAQGTADANLPLYQTQVPIDYVLEVNAGFSDKMGIKEGDGVDLSQI